MACVVKISYNTLDMSKQLEKLISAIAGGHTEPTPPKGEVISVDETVSKAASIYEAVRNTLEYDEVHRLRRNAIRRILKRHLDGEEDMYEVARDLLHELIWAGYLPNNLIATSVISDLAKVLDKYRKLFQVAGKQKVDPDQMTSWLLDLLSTEVEYIVSPPTEAEGLATYAYTVVKSKIEWKSKLVRKDDREMQLFLAVYRTLLRSNIASLRYRVFLLFYPDWPKASQALIEEITGNLAKVYDHVETQVDHPAADSLNRLVRRYVIMFNVLHDIIANDPEKAIEILSTEEGLKKAVNKAAAKRYKDFYAKTRRGIFRAVIFLFFTKMLLALVIELPYDVVVLQTTNYIPLITNVVFFPILLGVIGMTVSIPQKKNTEMIFSMLKTVLYGEGEMSLVYRTKRPWRSTAGRVFDTLYLLMFIVSYGLIAYGLYSVDFNTLSIVIFLFFLSLVMFFGVRIRMTKRDLIIVKGRGGIGAALFDFYFLPIIRAGRWMALRAPRINVFLFFLDYIVEAPFKMAIALIEGWLAFIREKKEEIE